MPETGDVQRLDGIDGRRPELVVLQQRDLVTAPPRAVAVEGSLQEAAQDVICIVGHVRCDRDGIQGRGCRAVAVHGHLVLQVLPLEGGDGCPIRVREVTGQGGWPGKGGLRRIVGVGTHLQPDPPRHCPSPVVIMVDNLGGLQLPAVHRNLIHHALEVVPIGYPQGKRDVGEGRLGSHKGDMVPPWQQGRPGPRIDIDRRRRGKARGHDRGIGEAQIDTCLQPQQAIRLALVLDPQFQRINRRGGSRQGGVGIRSVEHRGPQSELGVVREGRIHPGPAGKFIGRVIRPSPVQMPQSLEEVDIGCEFAQTLPGHLTPGDATAPVQDPGGVGGIGHNAAIQVIRHRKVRRARCHGQVGRVLDKGSLPEIAIAAVPLELGSAIKGNRLHIGGRGEPDVGRQVGAVLHIGMGGIEVAGGREGGARREEIGIHGAIRADKVARQRQCCTGPDLKLGW